MHKDIIIELAEVLAKNAVDLATRHKHRPGIINQNELTNISAEILNLKQIIRAQEFNGIEVIEIDQLNSLLRLRDRVEEVGSASSSSEINAITEQVADVLMSVVGPWPPRQRDCED